MYGDSIGFEGLLAAADVLAEPRWEGWVHGALKAWAGRLDRTFRFQPQFALTKPRMRIWPRPHAQRERLELSSASFLLLASG